MPEDQKNSAPEKGATTSSASTPAGAVPPETPPIVASTANPQPAAPPSTAKSEAAPKAADPAAAKPAAPAAAKPAVPPRPAAPPKAVPIPWEDEMVAGFKRQYGSGIREAATYLGQKYLVVDKTIAYEILKRMREDHGFDYCVDVTAVHYPKREPDVFDVLWILYSFASNERVRVKTVIGEADKTRSVVDLWPTADWLEREVFDMFGIEFLNHPKLTRILLPEGWEGFPLRKDYPITKQDQKWVQINVGIESGQ